MIWECGVRRRANRGRERGQAIAEFALAASLGLTFIFAIIDFGRALFAYDLVGNAARIGTRYAIVNAAACRSNVTNCQQAISDYVLARSPGIDQTKLQPLIFTWEPVSSTCTASYQPGCYVQIEVDYAFPFVILPLPGQTLKSTSRMVISQ